MSPKASGNRLVYAMRVAEVMPIDSYFADPRFEAKKPDPSGARVRGRGDNIYAPGPAPGQFRQLPSLHSRADGGEDLGHARRDLGGLNVLVSDEFWYFGGSGPALPEHLAVLIGGRGHKVRFPPAVVEEFGATRHRLCCPLPAGGEVGAPQPRTADSGTRAQIPSRTWVGDLLGECRGEGCFPDRGHEDIGRMRVAIDPVEGVRPPHRAVTR